MGGWVDGGGVLDLQDRVEEELIMESASASLERTEILIPNYYLNHENLYRRLSKTETLLSIWNLKVNKNRC